MQAELVPVVEVINSRPVVSSLKIAEQFEKNHKHVLRDIRKIIKDVSADFAGSNFGPCDYLGENGKQAPMFWLTKDGFMILVMGYTGKEFMRIKEAYICRFNEMEAQILGRTEHPATTTLTPSTAEDRKPLNALISAWIASSPLSYRGAWAQIHAHFNITKAADLPKEWLPDVIAFVQERMDSAIAAKPVHSLPSSTPARSGANWTACTMNLRCGAHRQSGSCNTFLAVSAPQCLRSTGQRTGRLDGMKTLATAWTR